MTNLEQAKLTGRLTFVGTVYFQFPNEPPHGVDLAFGCMTQSDEQMWQRRFTVGKDWKRLDLGWLDGKAGMVLLVNEEGKHQQVIPTPAEREAVKRRVVELAFRIPMDDYRGSCLVRPGRPFLCELACSSLMEGPEGATELYLRCLEGEARCVVTAYPR